MQFGKDYVLKYNLAIWSHCHVHPRSISHSICLYLSCVQRTLTHSMEKNFSWPETSVQRLKIRPHHTLPPPVSVFVISLCLTIALACRDVNKVRIRGLSQRTLIIGGSISVWLTSCLTDLDSTKQANQLLIRHKQSS